MIRFFDILLSTIGIFLLSPVMVFLAIWIKVDSPGSVIYKQIRVGKGNMDFTLYKFRSMRIGSDKKGLLTIGGNDPRVTSSGLFIRRFKLDEIPQLFNVLRGDMSLVGPRPEVRKYVDLYNSEQLKVLNVRPGITDLASIKYINENEILSQFSDPEKAYIETVMNAKIALNLEYIENKSVLNYFKIIFLTIIKIF